MFPTPITAFSSYCREKRLPLINSIDFDGGGLSDIDDARRYEYHTNNTHIKKKN